MGKKYRSPKQRLLKEIKAELPKGFTAKIYKREKNARRKLAELQERHMDPPFPGGKTWPELERRYKLTEKLWVVSYWKGKRRRR